MIRKRSSNGQLAIGLLPDILKHGVGGQGLYTYSAALTDQLLKYVLVIR